MAERPLIDSPRNALVRRLVRLHDPRERERSGQFLAEGPKLALEALDAGILPREALYSPRLERSARGAEVLVRLQAGSTRLQPVSERALAALSDAETHQGLVSVLDRTAGRAALSPEPGRDRRLLVAVGVQDPGNLGALVRVAEAFGAAALLAVGGADPWSPKAVRAAAGSLFRLPVARHGDDALLASELAARGYLLVAAVPRGGLRPRPEPAERPLALWVGSEGEGLGARVLEHCAEHWTVPLAPPVESLNVATAAAVLLYALGAGARTA